MSDVQRKLDEMKRLTQRLQKEYPMETNAFIGFLKKAEAGPALGLRDKELINVALAVAAQCEWCIAFHVQQAVGSGASRDELIEAGFMAVIMHGGPAYMYMTPLLQALDEMLPGGD
jgi:AhpD family alkylhydroperoxidase